MTTLESLIHERDRLYNHLQMWNVNTDKRIENEKRLKSLEQQISVEASRSRL